MALVLLTAFCLWLGMVVAPALRQERIVRAVEEAGGEVSYDYEWDAEVREMIEWDGIGGQGTCPRAPRATVAAEARGKALLLQRRLCEFS